MKIEQTFWKNLTDDEPVISVTGSKGDPKIDALLGVVDKAIAEAEKAKVSNRRKSIILAVSIGAITVTHLITQAMILWRVW